MAEKKVKRYVDVEISVNKKGIIRPLKIFYDGQRTYQIDEVLGVERCAADVGGIGNRYTCRIKNKTTYLWQESGKWFVEARSA